MKFQATDGKGTKFESINLPQSSNTSDFFGKERERAQVYDQAKREDISLLRSIGLVQFSGQTGWPRVFFFPGILSGSFWSKNLKYKCYINHVASVTLTVTVTRIRTGKRSIIPTKLMIVLVLLRRNNCMWPNLSSVLTNQHLVFLPSICHNENNGYDENFSGNNVEVPYYTFNLKAWSRPGLVKTEQIRDMLKERKVNKYVLICRLWY